MNKKEFKSETDLFDFGKYNGQSIAYVFKNDFKYIQWCQEKIDGFKIDEELLCSLNNNKINTTPEVTDINSLKELELLVDKAINLLTEKKILTTFYERDYSVLPELDHNDIINSAINRNLFLQEQQILEKSIEKIDSKVRIVILQLKNYLLKHGIKDNGNAISITHRYTGYQHLDTINLSGTLNEDDLTLSAFNLAFHGDLIEYSFDLQVG